MKKKAIKKKKAAKKSLGHNQVPRPSHKKPRPKKYVEPKLPNTDKLPEAINASVAEDYIAGILSEPELRSTLEKLNHALDDIEENARVYTDEFKTDAEAKLEQPIKVEVELPPGKTEKEVVKSINLASELMKNQYDAAIDEISNLYGEEYHTRGLAWGAGDKVRIQKVEPNITQDKQDLIDLNKELMKTLLDTRLRSESIPPRMVRIQKEGFFARLAKWLWS